ncbi:MAG: VWA domain-containing protein [Ignavibacterium album]|uniref:vWA domain-containing protein n=1 Tax=Ignavibacterium album TaxID=591197 RepID=UPI0026ECD679|nr:vWA domain-containing protein [Ignavibacterium album]MCX8106712.1 VWA domain-containing protein [Ignavibacterium album]
MNSLTHITVILDRSGSMQSIKSDIIGGFNTFLKQQKEVPGKATLTLVQFDTGNPYEVIHNYRPLQEIPELNDRTFVPRGGTPLLDCLGRGINDLSEHINKLTNDQKPDKVFFIIITDGQENSSREFKKSDIVKLIDEKKNKDNWEFLFLSADLDAIGDARLYGVNQTNVYVFNRDTKAVNKMWENLSASMSKARIDRNYKIDLSNNEEQKI